MSSMVSILHIIHKIDGSIKYYQLIFLIRFLIFKILIDEKS